MGNKETEKKSFYSISLFSNVFLKEYFVVIIFLHNVNVSLINIENCMLKFAKIDSYN